MVSSPLSPAVEQLRKPKLKLGLKDTTAKKGEKAILKAVITGDPVPDIKWWKDGEPLLPDKDPNVIINCDTKFIQDDLKECTYSVTIPSARHKDTGQYSLKATNKFGEIESSVSTARSCWGCDASKHCHKKKPDCADSGFPLLLLVSVKSSRFVCTL